MENPAHGLQGGLPEQPKNVPYPMKKTPLYDTHIKLGAQIIDFHGFQMPLFYEGIVKEHLCVRNSAGIFDISHMGVIEIKGRRAAEFVQMIITNDAGNLHDGTVIYSPICNEQGGIIDDVMVYRFTNERFILVVNCANVEKDLKWFSKNIIRDVEINNLSGEVSIIAIQGPMAGKILSYVCNEPYLLPDYHKVQEAEFNKISVYVSRSGYTGEDGFEIYSCAKDVREVWETLLDVGCKKGLQPVGLGARDTLRLEASLPLYGNELDETITPIEADLRWTVRLKKADFFIGKDALTKQDAEGIKRRLAGFIMVDKGVPRTGYLIKKDGKVIGKVTSGSYSPSTDNYIGLGYVEPSLGILDERIWIDIRTKERLARIVKTPFYTRPDL